MQNAKHFVIFLLTLCVGILSIGLVSAQDTGIILSESYTAPEDRIIFLYPTGWTVDKQNTFVAVTDTKTTIEFYTVSASSRTIKLASNDLEKSVLLFLDILGIEAEDNQQTQVELIINDDDEDNQTVIGTTVLADGRLQYILLVKGLLMEDPGLVFVRVEGSALDLLDNPDTFLAIIQTFGTLIAPDDTNSTTATTTTTTTNTTNTQSTTSVPCTVRATNANTATLRVGPGTNRSILLFLDPADEFVVQGTANDSTGARWWRLDKNEAAPEKAAVVNETWVSDAQMTESGDCENIGTVAAPPIIRIRPTAAPVATSAPNATAQPTPIPGSTDPFVSFYASTNTIAPGDCLTLFWDTQNIKEIYLTDEFGSETGVTGPSGSKDVCPSPGLGFNFVLYTLRVVTQSNTDIFNNVEIFISSSPTCLVPYPSYNESGTVTGTNIVTHDYFIDTTICGLPVTVYIDVLADNSDMDPYIDVYLDGVYYGSDDDGGSGLDAFMVLTISSPTLLTVDVSNLLQANGAYIISVYIE